MPPTLKDRNGAIVGYTVVLTNSETNEQFTYSVEMLSFQVERKYSYIYHSTVKSLCSSYNIGLSSFTVFEVSVSAQTESGRGPNSEPVYVKTSESGMDIIISYFLMFCYS